MAKMYCKARLYGTSMIITIPPAVVEYFDILPGDLLAVEFELKKDEPSKETQEMQVVSKSNSQEEPKTIQ